MTRRSSNQLLAFADVLMSFATLAAGVLGSIERASYRKQQAALNAARLHGITLKNELTARKIQTEVNRTAVTSNNIVLGDIKIETEELKLKLLRETAKNLGIDKPVFVAQGYPEPGDVRRGILPPE